MKVDKSEVMGKEQRKVSSYLSSTTRNQSIYSPSKRIANNTSNCIKQP